MKKPVYDKCSKPYTRYDDRMQVDAWKNGVKKTLLLSRYLMEEHLGRQLSFDETVDHINGDKTDDRLDNLRVVSRARHASEDSIRVKDVTVKCAWCSTPFVVKGKNIRNRDRGKAGPFCSKSCSGKYGKAVQTGEIEKFAPQSHEREYYKIDKSV